MPSVGDMLDKALTLVESGFAVLPLSEDSKKPLPGSNGVLDATRDREKIFEWWTDTPHNIGIAPWASDPRMIVVDLDKKGDEDGEATLGELELEHGLLPPTLTVRTPGGGTHLYYSVGPDEAPISNSARWVGRGIDVRAVNGYVVAPGSVIGGRSYEIVRPDGGEAPAGAAHIGAAVQPAPLWLLHLARGSFDGGLGPSNREPTVELDLAENIERAIRYLSREADAGRVAVSGRGGNNFTYRTAAVVRDFGIAEETCARLMLAYWNELCQPPWDGDDLRSIVANVYAYGKRAPGEARTANPDAVAEMQRRAAEAQEAAPAEAPASRFRLLPWPDLMSMKPPTFMVAGTIPERSVVEIYGPYSSYKSFLAVDIALACATGVEWARRPVSRKYRAVYVAGEGAFGLRSRAGAWAKAHSLGSISGFALLPTMPIFADDADLRSFADAVRPFGPELIVLDTAAHAMAGLDENAAKDAGIFMARCFELRDAFGATIMLVHHSGKDVDRGSRGSTAIPAAVDVILRVEAPRPLEALVTMEKQKDAETWKDPQGFRAQLVEGSLVFAPQAIMPSSADNIEQKRMEALQAVLERLPEGMTIETKPLAHEMATILNPTLDDGGREKLASALRQWLNRSARDLPAAQPFLAQKGISRGEANLWRRPATREE